MRQWFLKVTWASRVILTGVLPLLSQAPREEIRSFEVASIKQNRAGQSGGSISTAGGRFIATNVTVKLLINYAYPPSKGRTFLNSQIVGGPPWNDTDRFDIQARPEGETRPRPIEEMQLMVKALLEDRFRLRVHRETREQEVYNLVVTRSGKIPLSEDQTPPAPAGPSLPSTRFDPTAPPPRGLSRITGTASTEHFAARAVPMGSLATMLQQQVQRIVVDKTGMSGLFDIDLQFDPRQSTLLAPSLAPGAESTLILPSDAGVSVFTALQEQLGLKLEPGRGPVEVLVIDRVERPSEN